MPEGIPYYLRNAGLRHHSKPKYVKYNMIARIKQKLVGVTGGVDAINMKLKRKLKAFCGLTAY